MLFLIFQLPSSNSLLVWCCFVKFDFSFVVRHFWPFYNFFTISVSINDIVIAYDISVLWAFKLGNSWKACYYVRVITHRFLCLSGKNEIWIMCWLDSKIPLFFIAWYFYFCSPCFPWQFRWRYVARGIFEAIEDSTSKLVKYAHAIMHAGWHS